MFQRIVPAYKCEIFICGDIEQARQICRTYCDQVGLCVTVKAADYIYTGGSESGIVVGLINYGRFPTAHELIRAKAVDLGHVLLRELNQQSFTVQDNYNSMWFSNRPEDN
jgi:hypothetical protein